MTERLDPIRPYGDRRQYRRRDEDQQARTAPRSDEAGGLPVPVSPVETHDHISPPPLDGQSAFSAQLLGQPGVKRGLRGGPAVIEAARSAYLETEYSGESDRRPRKGLLKKAEI